MTDTPAAPHTPSDDPRVDILAEALVAEWRLDVSRLSDRRGGPTYKRARDLLARLDAAAPARDDAADDEDDHRCVPPSTGARGDRYTCWCRRRWECQKTDPLKWISTHQTIDEIGLATGSTMRPSPTRDDALARWLDGEIAESEQIESEALDEGDQWLAAGHDQRARTLREVRDRLSATTNEESA